MVGIVQPKADPWCCLHFTKYKFNVYRKKYIRSGRDSAVVGIVGKSKSLDFLKMLIFWSLVRNSVVLAVYLLFSVACFFTVHEHWCRNYHLYDYGSCPDTDKNMNSLADCLFSNSGDKGFVYNETIDSHYANTAACTFRG